MLQPAQLYKDKLYREYMKTWYNPEYMYYADSGDRLPNLPDSNYSTHHFVCVDKDYNLIGYISYSLNWVAMSADRLGIISFDRGNALFAKDVYQVICDLFEKYHMNRISWSAYADNPAVRGYRNFIKRHGGRECGYYRQIARLQDGKLHDSVQFEMLAEEFKK